MARSSAALVVTWLMATVQAPSAVSVAPRPVVSGSAAPAVSRLPAAGLLVKVTAIERTPPDPVPAFPWMKAMGSLADGQAAGHGDRKRAVLERSPDLAQGALGISVESRLDLGDLDRDALAI